MCLAVPMKVIKIEGTKGITELANLQREIGLLLLENAKIGDYVIAHAGYAIQILDEKEALETLRILNNL